MTELINLHQTLVHTYSNQLWVLTYLDSFAKVQKRYTANLAGLLPPKEPAPFPCKTGPGETQSALSLMEHLRALTAGLDEAAPHILKAAHKLLKQHKTKINSIETKYQKLVKTQEEALAQMQQAPANKKAAQAVQKNNKQIQDFTHKAVPQMQQIAAQQAQLAASFNDLVQRPYAALGELAENIAGLCGSCPEPELPKIPDCESVKLNLAQMQQQMDEQPVI